MAEHNFTLRISGDVESRLDDLFEAGCDDALIHSIDGVWYADFDREALTMEEAVVSAIADVGSVEGIEVKRVEPDDIVTASEIAERLGRSRESIRLLISGERGNGDFPAPLSHSRARNKLWHWFEVAEWADSKGMSVDSLAGETARSIAAINAALELNETMMYGLPQITRDAIADIYALG